MPRPLRKTAATSLKMTPEVRDLWEQCAAAENRSLTNMFEMMVRAYAKTLNVVSTTPAPGPAVKQAKKSAPKKH
jgi:uncharacterized protein (DUF1778 family)